MFVFRGFHVFIVIPPHHFMKLWEAFKSVISPFNTMMEYCWLTQPTCNNDGNNGVQLWQVQIIISCQETVIIHTLTPSVSKNKSTPFIFRDGGSIYIYNYRKLLKCTSSTSSQTIQSLFVKLAKTRSMFCYVQEKIRYSGCCTRP